MGCSLGLSLSLLLTLGCRDKTDQAQPEEQAESVVEVLENTEAPLPSEPLVAGQEVFDFTGLAHNGARVKLSDFSGSPVVVYFCASVTAAQCQALALDFRDEWLRLNPHVGMVLAVSTDDSVVLRAFAAEHELPQLLLSDPKGNLSKVFGLGAQPFVSYLLDQNGRVLQVFQAPQAPGHAMQVGSALEQRGLLREVPPP